MYFPPSYETIGVGVGDFGFCLGVGAGVDRFLGSFTLRDAVVMGGLLCTTSTLICEVSLQGDFCGVVSCLKISINLLISCRLVAPMDANRAIRDGSEMEYIRSSTSLVAES